MDEYQCICLDRESLGLNQDLQVYVCLLLIMCNLSVVILRLGRHGRGNIEAESQRQTTRIR